MAQSLARFGQPGNYNATPLARVDGGETGFEFDAQGNLRVNVMNFIQEGNTYKSAIATGAGTATIAAGAGTLRYINILGGVLGDVTVWDSVTNSGTVLIPTFSPTGSVSFSLNIPFANGLTFTTTSAMVIQFILSSGSAAAVTPTTPYMTVHIGSQSIDDHTNTQSAINAIVAALTTAIPHLTHIAIGTYLDYDVNSTDSQFIKWATAIHNAGKKMVIRSAGFNDWQGTNGVTQNTGRKNLVVNPDFETNDSFLATGGTASKVRTTAEFYAGVASLHMTGTTADDRVYYTATDGFTPVVSQAYTLSCYLKGTGTLRLWAYTGATDVYSSDIVLSSTWTRYSFTFTAAATTGVVFGFRQKNTEAFSCFIDTVMLEAGSLLGDYFDGATAFCSWDDVINPHNSVSSQSFTARSIQGFSNFVDNNAVIFQPGDVFEPLPDEPENNSLWNSVYGTIGSGAGKVAFNDFITNSITAINARLAANNISGVVTGYISSNPSVNRDVITDATATSLVAISSDDYPESNTDTTAILCNNAMASLLTTWIVPAHPSSLLAMTIGPNVNVQLSDAVQADAIAAEMDTIDTALGARMYALTIWQFGAGDNNPKSRLFDWNGTNWIARSACAKVDAFFAKARGG